MTPLIWTLVFLAGFLAVEFLAFAVMGARQSGRARARRRLQRLADTLHAQGSRDELSILREARGEADTLMQRTLGRFRLLEPLRLLLYRAGQPVALPGFVLISAACAGAGALLPNLLLGDPRLGVLGVAAGLVPLVWVVMRKRTRMHRFETLLPEALDLLSRALRAGHALSAGLQMVGDELPDPIGPEFAQVAEEVQFGLELPMALSNLAHRIDVPDMPFFVTALVIQRETGGNLAEIIDNLARVIRERHATNGKIRALTAQARWSANILLIAPFGFVAVMTMFRREYVELLWTTAAGNALTVVATVMVFIGYALCRRVGVVRV